MLLRTASAPLLNSCLPHSIDPSPEPEIFHHIFKPRSLTLLASSSSSSTSFSSSHDDSMRKMTRAFSDTDLREVAVPKRKPFNEFMDRITLQEEEEKTESVRYVLDLGSSLLNQEYQVETKGKNGGILVGDGGNGGGKMSGGGGGNGGPDGGDNGNSNHGKDITEIYYQKMIEANPGNSLLLSNYAKFLKEVCGDNERAEEYCGRAILANPYDGNALSMYADLIWQSHKDSSRAETYFDQAVKAAPDDCFVLASYARFLWDVEEDEDEDEDEGEQEEASLSSAPIHFHEVSPQPPPIAAAS